jgi:hypothetical protein
MGNIFATIPVLAANGSGAPVDMSAFGFSKSISVTGPFDAAVTIEVSNELVPTKWAPVYTFNNPDGFVFDVACRWMRATVAGYKNGAPACFVGGIDDGTLFASLPATPGNGAGAAVDTSLLPLFKTVTVGGPFSGNVQLEISENGATDWSQIGFGFSNPGQQSQVVAARFMRVVRTGVANIAPGLPLVDVAACVGAGGGAGSAIFNPMPLPEQWAVQGVPASTPPTAMSAQVSTNFDEIRAIRAGSIVGIAARLTEAIAAGILTVSATVNGAIVPVGLILGAGSTGGQGTAPGGTASYVAGDLIGIKFSTTVDFSPITTDLEAWLEVLEAV